MRNQKMIEKNMFEILIFIFNQNRDNRPVNFKDIARQFNIVYRTVANRLNILNEKGWIDIQKNGRSKELIITEKGRMIVKEILLD